MITRSTVVIADAHGIVITERCWAPTILVVLEKDVSDGGDGVLPPRALALAHGMTHT